LGVWVAGHTVPDEHHHILTTVGFVRYVGLSVLLAIEIKLVLAIYRAAFGRDNNAESAARAMAKDTGMPEWVSRLMAWEASMWRKAWDVVKRMAGRNGR